MTFRSPIFRKLFLGAALVISVTLAGLDFYLTRYTAQREVESVKTRLESNAHVLAGELPTISVQQLEAWSKAAGDRAKSRVTLIDPAGVVLADSQHDPETMENHANRPEIREALGRGVGSSLRHSHTLDRDLCYLALEVPYQGQRGYVLRLAVPLEDVEASVRAVRGRILLASMVAALLAVGIAFAFARSLTKRVDRLRAFAEGMASTPRPGGLKVAAQDELGSLEAALNRTGRQLNDLVDRLSLESARRAAILSSMVEGVLAVDEQMRVTFCNESFLHAIGQQGTPGENVALIELVRDPELQELLSKVLASGQAARQHLKLASADGRTFEAQAAPLAAPSGRGALAILHDITDLERLERIRKDFVANVSHELRTPLTAIRGYAETLLEGGLDDRENNRKFVEIINAHAIRLNNIASDLLTLSELESGEQGGETERISVRTAMETAMHAVESEARLREVSVAWLTRGDARVAGNKLRLEQAFVNLLDNAVKFNRPGGQIRVETGVAAEGQARIVVADTGTGIPSEHLPRIFERFYRVDRARSREVGGTGLGLSIVKHVVERMSGSVSVESEVGKGSTFTVLLPALPDEKAG